MGQSFGCDGWQPGGRYPEKILEAISEMYIEASSYPLTDPSLDSCSSRWISMWSGKKSEVIKAQRNDKFFGNIGAQHPSIKIRGREKLRLRTAGLISHSEPLKCRGRGGDRNGFTEKWIRGVERDGYGAPTVNWEIRSGGGNEGKKHL